MSLIEIGTVTVVAFIAFLAGGGDDRARAFISRGYLAFLAVDSGLAQATMQTLSGVF